MRRPRHQVSAATMAREFAWLTRQMAADDSMLGHAAFGLFAPDDPHWQNWQMMGIEALR